MVRKALTKHKILLFGQKVYGESKPKLVIDKYQVDAIGFPDEWNRSATRLADYYLVVLDYSAFRLSTNQRGIYAVHMEEQELFAKQMVDAFEEGTNFCIIHYDEDVPEPTKSFAPNNIGGMTAESVASYVKQQIGYRWLSVRQIRPHRHSDILLWSESVRNEFDAYSQRWGASRNYFTTYGNGEFDDVILRVGDDNSTGFAVSFGRSKLLYLPAQRDTRFAVEFLNTLIKSCVKYLDRIDSAIPIWAHEPIFRTEQVLYGEFQDLQNQVEATHAKLQPFQSAKSMAFMAEYELQAEVPRFLQDYLGMPIQQMEEYKEDFWVTNADGEQIVIGEIKSASSGLKKSAIYSLHNHREARGKPETFPGLLIVNLHLNAGSWKDKLQPINPQEINVAVNHKILIMRVEDLLFYWQGMIEKQLTCDDLVECMMHSSGWFEVCPDGTTKLHN